MCADALCMKRIRSAISDSGIRTAVSYRFQSNTPIPASMSKFNKYKAQVGVLRPTKKPDADNIAKMGGAQVGGGTMLDEMSKTVGEGEA